MKVLLCENEDVTRAAIEFRLTRQGHEVVRAKNGKEAQGLLALQNFDLLLADVAMGSAVTAPALVRWLREDQKDALPIILIAELEDDDEGLLEALAAGADDFITKPFKPLEMQLRIRRLVKNLN